MSIKHLMTFGTFNEQRYFTYPSPETYSCVIINANMAAHAPDGLGQFLIERTKQLNYIIDPMTHAFQHNVIHLTTINSSKERIIKTSIEKLKNIYGDPIASIAGKIPLNPSHFIDKGLLTAFVEKCVRFQLEQLSTRMLESPTNQKYLQQSQEKLKPTYLISPYFYMDETTFDQWIAIQIEMINKTILFKGESKVLAAITIGKGLLDDKRKVKELIESYRELNVDGYIIWVDDFNEHEASKGELDTFLKIIYNLNINRNREFINFHGSYFSVLAAGKLGEGLLSGVAHGPEYGEYRSVVPVGGGIPFAKYYVFGLHKRVKFKEAQRLFFDLGWLASSIEFYKNICDCNVCRNIIKENPDNFIEFGSTTPKKLSRKSGEIWIDYPTPSTKENCLLHYLENKNREFNFSEKGDEKELFENLNNGIRIFENQLGERGIVHLKRWKEVFEKKEYLIPF